MRSLFVLIASLLSTVCCFAQSNSFVNSLHYIGYNKAILYQRIGKPTTIKSDGLKGEIMAYESKDNIITSKGTTLTLITIETFYVDKKGVIYNWGWESEVLGLKVH